MNYLVTFSVLNADPVSVLLTEQEMTDYAKDQDDYATYNLGAYFSALAVMLDASHETDEFFLEGVHGVAYICRAGNIQGFSIEPVAPPKKWWQFWR